MKDFDMLGEEIQTLISQELDARKHTVEFDGIYIPVVISFYLLKSGGSINTKNLILQK